MVVRLSEGEEIVPTQRSVMETFPALTDVLFGVVRVLEAPRQDDLVEELLITRGGRFYCDKKFDPLIAIGEIRMRAGKGR